MGLYKRSTLKKLTNQYFQQKTVIIYDCFISNKKNHILNERVKTKGEGCQKKEI